MNAPSDIDLELAAFLGTDFGQSIQADLGEASTALVWLSAAQSIHAMIINDHEITANEIEAAIEAVYSTGETEVGT